MERHVMKLMIVPSDPLYVMLMPLATRLDQESIVVFVMLRLALKGMD